MLIIGLTGGIGCGKTTVSQLFENANVPVIDADEISRAIVKTGQPALSLLTSAFGGEILSPNGSLNKSYLRELVFNHPNNKEKLENILHPIIYQKMYQQLAKHKSPYGILSIPLLFETNHRKKVDRVLVVDCSEETQRNRVKARDEFDDSMIDSIIKAQCTRPFRLLHADDILNNDNSLDNLEKDVSRLHNTYLKMSADQVQTRQGDKE